MPQSGLHSFYICPCLDQLCGVGMPQGVVRKWYVHLMVYNLVAGIEHIRTDQHAVFIQTDYIAPLNLSGG